MSSYIRLYADSVLYMSFSGTRRFWRLHMHLLLPVSLNDVGLK